MANKVFDLQLTEPQCQAIIMAIESADQLWLKVLQTHGGRKQRRNILNCRTLLNEVVQTFAAVGVSPAKKVKAKPKSNLVLLPATEARLAREEE